MTRCIIVPLDGSSLSESALARAAELASLTKDTIHLVRVHVPVLAYAAAESPVAIPDPAWDAQVRDAAQAWLTRAALRIAPLVGTTVTHELRVGSPVDEIVAVGKERDARAIVCTTHGHGGWAPQWLGSVADGIIRHATCPVIAMSETAAGRSKGFKRILVPLDGSETASAILPHVRELARASGATVEFFRVVSPPWVGDVLNGLQSGSVDKFGIDPAADVAKVELDRLVEEFKIVGVHATSSVEVATNPTRAILDRIRDVDPDLVAMSTHGRGFSRVFMGSVADKILRSSGHPVFLCRAPRPTSMSEADRMFATAASGATA